MTSRLIVPFLVPFALLLAEAPAPEKCVIEGKVFSASGEPLRKATLHLRATGAAGSGIQALSNYAVTSDASGRFLFDDVDPGRYTLSAERTGYVQQYYGARGPNRTGLALNLAAGAPLTGIVITLTPQGIISGKVEDEDGEPVANAQVDIYRMGYQSGQKQLLLAGNTSVNAEGGFLAGHLAPGRYYLSASDGRLTMTGTTGERSGSKAVQDGYLKTYYPNVIESSAATPIDIGSGVEVRGIEIRLVKGRLYQIRGKVTGPEITGAMSLVLSANQSMARPTAVQRDGSFSFQSVAPGEYTIRSNRVGPRNPAEPARLFAYSRVIVRDQDILGLEVRLSPGPEISGTIKLDGAAPAMPPVFRIVLQDVQGNFGVQNAPSRPDGSFEIRGMAPEKYRVSVTGQPQGTYIKAIRFGNVDITRDYLDLTPGSGGALEILVSPKAADVSGVVRDENGDPVPNVTVTLWTPGQPANGFFAQPRVTNTDATGAFQIVNLAPGEYRVAAWEDIEAGLVQNPDFRARFENTAAKVTVQESTHATADTKLIGQDAIQAEVAKLP